MTIHPKGGVAPGDLDPSFGREGRVFLDFQDATFNAVHGLHAMPGGKILAVGTALNTSFIVGCLTENGEVDRSFGQNGSMIGKFATYTSIGDSVTALDDGKILVGGRCYTSNSVLPAVSRLLPGGEFDTTFANGGTFVFPPVSKASGEAAIDPSMPSQIQSSDSVGMQTKVLADGKILLSYRSTSDYKGLLIRLTADGIPDGSFNSTGFTTVHYPDPNTRFTEPYSFIVTAKNEIILCGRTGTLEKPNYSFLARFGENGRPDISFGSDGTGYIDVEIDHAAVIVSDITANQDGGLVAFGRMTDRDSGKISAIAFGLTPNGAPDTNFNNGQIVRMDRPFNNAWNAAAVSAATDKLIAIGVTLVEDPNLAEFIVGRYLRSGQLDKEFGRGKGWVTFDIGVSPGLILQNDEKILVRYNSLSGTSALVRLLN